MLISSDSKNMDVSKSFGYARQNHVSNPNQ